MAARQILRSAFPLIPSYGFTRQAIVVASQNSSTPLNETAISALFGKGEDAGRALILAWLDEARKGMQGANDTKSSSMEDILWRRLEMNEPVRTHLKEAFALLATPSSSLPLPILDPRPAISHALTIADEACTLCHPPHPSSASQIVPTNWYTRRIGLAAIYTAAELHQLSSPQTARTFLRQLLKMGSRPAQVVHELGLYSTFIGKGWAGILKGRGFPGLF